MKKRLVALGLVLAMMVSMLTGCGGGGKDEPITLTCYSQLANYSGELTGWFAKELLERFNVKILIVPDTDGVYETRMEAGNLGDIVIWGSDGDKYQNAVKQGLLFDWNEDGLLSTYGSYIEENMPYALEKNQKLTSSITEGADDTLYGFGHNVATSSSNHEDFFYTWDIRWDLYKELGYPEVKDLDDYLQLLIDMKELCPTDDAGNETYAASLWPDWDGSMVMYVKSMATAYYGYDELALGLYNTETGEFYDPLMEDGPYLNMLEFFNKLYQNDLLDPDSMTQTYDEMIAKVQNGGTFFSIFNYSGSAGYNSDTHISANKFMASLAPDEAQPIVYGMSVMGGNRLWTIGAKTQYPELCMEIINWLSTPEGRMTAEHGPQGITWDYDAEGNTYTTELGTAMHFDRTTEFPEDTGYYGEFNDGANQMNNVTWSINATNPMSNGETYNWDNWKSNQVDPLCDTEADWRAYFGVDNTQQYLNSRAYKVAPATTYSESSKSDELKVSWEQVTKAIVDGSWKAIYAATDEEFDEAVANMTSTVTSYDYDSCVDWSKAEAERRHELEMALK